jgi:hypothetical protein
MDYEFNKDRSQCTRCGYTCPGNSIYSCPQCQQLELLKRQNHSTSGSSGGFESSLIGYAIGAVLLMAFIGFLLELASAIINFIVDALNALWNLILTPFVFVAKNTGLSVGFSALIMFGALAALLIYVFSSQNNDAGKAKNVKPRRSNSIAKIRDGNSSKPVARKPRFKREAALDKDEMNQNVSTRKRKTNGGSVAVHKSVKNSIAKSKGQTQSETPVRKRSKAQGP